MLAMVQFGLLVIIGLLAFGVLVWTQRARARFPWPVAGLALAEDAGTDLREPDLQPGLSAVSSS
jgi:hypothetical protein